MVGLLLTYNNFKFLNLIDLDWYMEMELSCREDRNHLHRAFG